MQVQFPQARETWRPAIVTAALVLATLLLVAAVLVVAWFLAVELIDPLPYSDPEALATVIVN